MKRKTTITLLLVLAAGSYMGYRLYNKKHIDVVKTDAAFTMSARAIFEAFKGNEEQATLQYADQVITVSGVISEVDLSNDMLPQLVLEANGDNGFVRCDFNLEFTEKLAELEAGSTLIVKGMCKGMNSNEELDLLSETDVSLANCIIIE